MAEDPPASPEGEADGGQVAGRPIAHRRFEPRLPANACA